MNEIDLLKKEVVKFRDEREWKQFHNPKDVAQAISIEASELLEHFLWVSQEESQKVALNKLEKVSEEMADIFIYLLSFSDVTGIDLLDAVKSKLEKNNQKYPIEKCIGSSKKYDEL